MTFTQILNDCGKLWLVIGLGYVFSIFVILYMEGWGLPGRDLKSFWKNESLRKELIHCYTAAGCLSFGIAVGLPVLGTLLSIV